MSQEKTPKKPLIIAHRGASALAPENTLAAFALALKQGADGIELDVMLTRDKELAVIHDASVDRTTNGNGLVAEMTLADLRKLDAGSKFSPDFAGEPIPTLRQVLELTGSRILVNIELKNYAHPLDALTECVIRLVQEMGLSQSVLLSSFNPLNLSRAKRLDPDIRRGLLTFPGKAGALLRGPVGKLFSYQALHPYYEDVNPKMVQAQHKMGNQINVWTVDNPVELRRMRDYGVDMLICNDPAAARLALEA